MFRRIRYRDGTAQEFQRERPGEALPDTLYGGPPPWAARGSVDNSGGDVGRAGPTTAESQLGEPWSTLLRGVQRKGNLTPQYASVSTTAVLVRPMEDRLYIIIQNTSLANTLYVGVGYPPTTVTGVLLAANGGAYEPTVVPQQEIWLLGSAANTTFVILYANG